MSNQQHTVSLQERHRRDRTHARKAAQEASWSMHSLLNTEKHAKPVEVPRGMTYTRYSEALVQYGD